MLGGLILLSLYLAACVARWRIARHYGQSFRWMGPVDLLDAWEHLRYSGHCLLWRFVVVSWFLMGVLTCASSKSN